MSASLTAQQAANFDHVTSLAPPRTRVRLDLSDDRQYEHAVAMHTLAGQTPEEFPGLHKALALARDAHLAEGPPPLSASDDQGFTTGAVVSEITRVINTQNAGAAGFSSVLGGSPMLLNALIVKDQNANVLAKGQSSQYGDGTYLGVTTGTADALQITAQMTGILMYTYQSPQSGQVITEHVTVATSTAPTADPVITQPVKRAGTPGPQLRIGLGRGNGATNDVDYWFWQGQQSTTYAVPLCTTIPFDGTVLTPVSANVQAIGSLARGSSAPAPDPGPKGGVLQISDAQVLNILNSTQASGSQLTVTMPAATSSTDPGNPIVWIPAPWDTSEQTYFYLQLIVNLQGQSLPAIAQIMSSSQGDVDALDGLATIPPIQFVFHCLAEGTAITLADGTTKAIEALTAEDLVRRPDGDAPVVSTMLGNHAGEVVRLRAGDRELVLSHGHLVLTPNGVVPAYELSPGDEVVLEDGPATLDEAGVEAFDGLLANASLSAPDEPADPARNVMIANGFVVGDYELQVQDARARRDDPERILSTLDPVFHEDFRRHHTPSAA
jgi:hypothetical protein